MGDTSPLGPMEGVNAHQPEARSLAANRNTAWRERASQNVTRLLRRITQTVITHDSPRVREALVRFATRHLQQCLGTLAEAVPIFIDILVFLTRDGYDEVSQAARTSLDKFSAGLKRLDPAGQGILGMLTTNFNHLVVTLPRIVRSADSKETLRVVALVNSYMTLLGDHLRTVLQSPVHVERLSIALVQILEFDQGDLAVISERSLDFGRVILAGSPALDIPPVKKQFVHLNNDAVVLEVCKCCHLLGRFGDVQGTA